jgi:hypothetical protein
MLTMTAAVASAMLGTACSSGGTGAPAGSELQAIREARTAYAEPAEALGTAVRAAVAGMRTARLQPPDSAADGEPAVAPRAFVIDEAARLLDDVAAAAVAVDASTAEAAVDVGEVAEPSVRVAAQAWSDALREAQRLVAAGRAEVELLRAVLQAEATMALLAALWDQPGSRSQQIQRLGDAADDSQDVVDALATLGEVPACSLTVQRRRDAAMLVAQRTAELHEFVQRGQGSSFDEARASYHAQPWHQGLPGSDAQDGRCWDASSGVSVAGDGVERALEDLVAALNAVPRLSSPAPPEG